ncbi:DUF3826 domain-containing protein [Botrimarina sp.]|uniref:DUF3826 domain-containing protein n=1 Tax=Botrimarina sp. TaxID=2795802 RepID=UPI0032EC7D4B
MRRRQPGATCTAALLLAALIASSGPARADATGGAAQDDQAYRRVVEGRAARIVEDLGLTGAEQEQRVVDAIADQYEALSAAHDRRDERLAAAGADETAVRDAAHREVVELHRRFVARLAAELAAEQVDTVKDGMTYGVVPITYAGYVRLLPDLTDDQKRMILANLLEAREHAMDAGSSDEKHAWFGKYKGRINNRLSEAGYDLKQAERDLAEREGR